MDLHATFTFHNVPGGDGTCATHCAPHHEDASNAHIEPPPEPVVTPQHDDNASAGSGGGYPNSLDGTTPTCHPWDHPLLPYPAAFLIVDNGTHKDGGDDIGGAPVPSDPPASPTPADPPPAPPSEPDPGPTPTWGPSGPINNPGNLDDHAEQSTEVASAQDTHNGGGDTQGPNFAFLRSRVLGNHGPVF